MSCEERFHFLRKSDRRENDRYKNRDRLTKRLKNFYIRRCPEKAENQELLDSVVERLMEYPEKEALFKALLEKYPKAS